MRLFFHAADKSLFRIRVLHGKTDRRSMLAGIANDWQENDANEMFALTIITNQVAGLTGSLWTQRRGMDTVSCYAMKIEFVCLGLGSNSKIWNTETKKT